jgi:outer membrane protein assembly factor BamB
VPDLLWAGGEYAEVLALSGSTGRVLWFYEPSLVLPANLPPAEDLELSYRVNGTTVGLPVLHTPAGGKPLLLTSFVLDGAPLRRLRGQGPMGPLPPARLVEALEAETGKRVWRFVLDNRWFAERSEHPDLFGPHLSPGKRPLALVVAGEHLVGLDPATGKPAWPPVRIGFVPFGEPRYADLDGDGAPEALLLDRTRGELVVLRLPSGRVLWRRKVLSLGLLDRPTRPNGEPPGEPLVADLDGDGRPEVTVRGETGRVVVLDGVTGKERWAGAKEGSRYGPAPDRFVVGPDLDGDGRPELFVARHVRDRYRDQHLLRVLALSGAGGRVLWQARLPAPQQPEGWPDRPGPPLFWWQRGRDGWPLLVVPGARTFVVEASCGRLAHFLPLPGKQADTDDLLVLATTGERSRVLVTRLDGATGETRWSAGYHLRPEAVRGSLLGLNGGGTTDVLLAFGEGDDKDLLIFDGSTGRLLWQQHLSSWTDRPFDRIGTGKDALVVYRDDAVLVVREGAAGREERHQLRGPGFLGVLGSNPRLIRTRGGPALAMRTHLELLRLDLGGKVQKRLLLRETRGAEVAPADGQRRRSASPGPTAWWTRAADLAPADGQRSSLLVFDGDQLAAVDADTWAVRWRSRVEFPASTRLAQDLPGGRADPETVVLHAGEQDESRLWGVDVKTGDVRWRYQGRGTVLGLARAEGEAAPRVFVEIDQQSTACDQAVPTSPDGSYRWPERGDPPTQLDATDWRPLPFASKFGGEAPPSASGSSPSCSSSCCGRCCCSGAGAPRCCRWGPGRALRAAPPGAEKGSLNRGK